MGFEIVKTMINDKLWVEERQGYLSLRTSLWPHWLCRICSEKQVAKAKLDLKAWALEKMETRREAIDSELEKIQEKVAKLENEFDMLIELERRLK